MTDEALALLREIRDDLRSLTSAIAASGEPRSKRSLPDDEHSDLVRFAAGISAAIGDRTFSVRELLRHSELDPALHGTLTKAIGDFDSHTARRIGKRLQRAENQPLNGLRVERLNRERNGAVWKIVKAARL